MNVYREIFNPPTMTVDSFTLVLRYRPFHNLLPLSFSRESTACLLPHTGLLSRRISCRSRAMGCGYSSFLEFPVCLAHVFACLEPAWEGKGRLGEGVERVRIVRIDSLFLCGAFTIMKFELRSEELRTIIISLASVCVWLSTPSS